MNNLKVLVVEPDTKVLFAFSKVLEKEGCVCIQSGNISEAFNKVSRIKPNAIFLDVSRLDGDYDKIFEKVAEKKLLMPVIIISSHITENIKNLALNIGALQVIEKPLRLESVRHCLESIKAKLIEK